MRLNACRIEVFKPKSRHCAATRLQESQRGFTMIELVAVMVIVGILAVVAAPRFFDHNVFDSRGFYDQVITSLRYAQKAAIAQHRNVCVVFGANPASVKLTQVAAGSACPGTPPGNNLASPGGQATYSVSSSNASFQGGVPPMLSFDALGRPYGPTGVLLATSQSITVNGYTTSSITVENETGYVH